MELKGKSVRIAICKNFVNFERLMLNLSRMLIVWVGLCHQVFTSTSNVQPLASGPHWKKSCLGPHIKCTNTNENWCAKKKKVLSKLMNLRWATFIAILGYLWPVGCRWDTQTFSRLEIPIKMIALSLKIFKDIIPNLVEKPS